MNVIVTEDQYLEDLAALYRRYRLHPGSSGAIESLSGQLQSNPAFRGDLFNLCTAISHMRETDLTPEEMLSLAARAVTGPKTRSRSGEPSVPPALRTLFVDEYARWATRNESQQGWFGRTEESSSGADEPGGNPLPRSATPFSSAASLSGTGRGWHTRPDATQLPAEPTAGPPAHSESPAAHSSIGPQTPIGDLTISQLRGYLDEIESRMDRLQPYLSSVRTTPEPVEPAPNGALTEHPATPASAPAAPEPATPGNAARDIPLLHRAYVPPSASALQSLPEPSAVPEAPAPPEASAVPDAPAPPETRTAAEDRAATTEPSISRVPGAERNTPPRPLAPEARVLAPEPGPTEHRGVDKLAAPAVNKPAAPETKLPAPQADNPPAPEAKSAPSRLRDSIRERQTPTRPRTTAFRTSPAEPSFQDTPLVSKERATLKPDTSAPEAEENEPIILLPLRGSSRPAESPLQRSHGADSNPAPIPVMFRNASGPEPAIFRRAEEPHQRGSGYVLAIAATLLLIATSGAAGYHYYNASRTPTVVQAPATSIAPPPQAVPEQTLPPASPNTPRRSGAIRPSPGAVAATPSGASPTKVPATTPVRPARPVSRAIQVEAEAARSEAQDNSTAAPTTRRPANTSQPAGSQGQQPATYSSEPR